MALGSRQPVRQLSRVGRRFSRGTGGCGGGEGGCGPIYCNVPQFYYNFSVLPLLKSFIFPPRKFFSLPLLSLGTLLGTL